MLASREDRTVAYAKPAYFAAQNVFAVFDDSLIPIADFPSTCSGTNKLAVYAYRQKDTGKQAVTLWLSGDMPSDSNVTTPVDLSFERCPFSEPVYADLRTGEVYSIPKANWTRVGDGIVLRQIPVYDPPVLIADQSILWLDL